MSPKSVPFVDLAKQHEKLEPELLEAVKRVLRHGQFILGPEVRELEERLATRLGLEHIVAVGSGIDALVIALQLRGIGRGDEVIVPSHSFAASAIAVDLVGATPVFADIEHGSLLLCPDSTRAAITPRTRAIMPVHLMGHPCAMDTFATIAAESELEIIEDCAQAIGARASGTSVGGFGIGAFSLHPLKILAACGDGGFLSLGSAEDVGRAHRLRNLGLVDRGICGEIARHSRLDTIQAALLLVKLDHFDGVLARRAAHARAYDEALAGRFQLVEPTAGAEPVHSAYVIRHPKRDQLIQDMAEQGFDLKIHYTQAIHQQPAYVDRDHGPLPNTVAAVDEICSLPVGAELDESDRQRLIDALLAWA